MYEQIIGGINKQEQNFYFYSILRLSEKLFCIRQADYYFIQVTLRYRSLYHTIIHKGNSLRCGYLKQKKKSQHPYRRPYVESKSLSFVASVSRRSKLVELGILQLQFPNCIKKSNTDEV